MRGDYFGVCAAVVVLNTVFVDPPPHDCFVEETCTLHLVDPSSSIHRSILPRCTPGRTARGIFYDRMSTFQ